jgi:ABC-type antimicrobial peptide transport system permease subunit
MLAVFLAAIGLYGVIAWTVTERTREIGIRVALGARIESVVRLVMKRVALLVVPGIALGLAGAGMIARLLRNQLFGVTPLDAATYLLAAGMFALVAIVACMAPTRAATRVDPASALRTD